VLLAGCVDTPTSRSPDSITPSLTASTIPDSTDRTLPTIEPTSTTLASREVPRFVDDNGFDDHSVPSVSTVDDLLALSRPGVGGLTVMKFTIPGFDQPANDPDTPRVHLMDSNFFGLHDEWYWFRLMNGQAAPADTQTVPFTTRRFATVQDIYSWARAQAPGELPIDLRFTSERVAPRLVSDRFYELALSSGTPRYGAGSVVSFTPADHNQPTRWLIELEYSDDVTPEHVARFFDALIPILPPEVGQRLEWVIRSPSQAATARLMADNDLPYGDRSVPYSELVPAGTVAVYNEGVTAGRLLYVGEDGASLGSATDTDILITERVPDYLPPAAAVITSDPQTPLAHINLLARNRNTPNASLSGVHVNAALRQAARVRTFAMVAAIDGELRIALITEEQFDSWRATQQLRPIAIEQLDLAEVPIVVDLSSVAAQSPTQAELDALVPLIGGKSAGFVTLLQAPSVNPPPDSIAITIAPYRQHIEPLVPLIRGLLGDQRFTSSPQVRWLALQGVDGYDLTFSSADDAALRDELLTTPAGSPLGDVLAAGGLRALIEARDIDPTVLTKITDELGRTYEDYDASVGLRFRSSSNVEDIEGFNGAGLYTSFTGFLNPSAQDDPDDRDNTVERAILRTWSSYWSFEAFEERRRELVDHLSGSMAITVHARFDDASEINNGVATWSFLPNGTDAVLEVNVQHGATPVTNPLASPDQPAATPEIIRVTRRDGRVEVERLSPSSLPVGPKVMSEADVRELFAHVDEIARLWRGRLNDSLPEAQQVRVITLDVEFKTVADGWPALDDDLAPYSSRLVVRQVRSLEPSLRRLPDEAAQLAIPRDVLRRAATIDELLCPSGRFIAVRTDDTKPPLLGFESRPLVVEALTGAVAVAPSAGCTRRSIYSAPAQRLLQLLDSGEALIVVDVRGPNS
jgi:hypothetical protein